MTGYVKEVIENVDSKDIELLDELDPSNVKSSSSKKPNSIKVISASAKQIICLYKYLNNLFLSTTFYK